MTGNFLEFEKPIAELQAKIEELRHVSANGELNISDEIARLERKSEKLTESIFASLSSWQVTQIARHPLRPYSLDYIDRLFTDFEELHGDRMFADDNAIVAGVARFEGASVAIVGHQKGRDTTQKVFRNFGMPKPEGYRKAQRIMRLAEKFQMPVITFIDTPGAYPGVGAEERGQSHAIAQSLYLMVELKTPILSLVIGEGGSGGALAIGVADRLLMMEYATYSVISPEGCASILWKDSGRAADAAEAMGVTTKSLKERGIIDAVIDEPLGGAHRDVDQASDSIRDALRNNLHMLCAKPLEELLDSRLQRLMAYGKFEAE
ncbi:MAG: acetyl-CoA carboxylase carboxyltransferase subunit alpha [Gammaproteobacteria bacterium]|nr:acetyl-CoA carboxylase carboxyltransferase subunit alpha [Gammaproteobacteria bacterium]MDH3467102.1 acetyl-CoA carboxylase carboxyltransferase subunit alpha [Gammaproteobacteria bacterium]